MTYSEKFRLLLETLHNTKYAIFKGNAEDAELLLKMRLQAISDYFSERYKYYTVLPIAKMRMDSESYKVIYEEIDGSRHLAHNLALSSAKALNDIYSKLGLGTFFETDFKDRKQATAEMLKFFSEIQNV